MAEDLMQSLMDSIDRAKAESKRRPVRSVTIRECQTNNGPLWYVHDANGRSMHWGGHMRREWAEGWAAERGYVVAEEEGKTDG
jgi:hypothetical protein